MKPIIKKFILSTFIDVFDFMKPNLSNFELFSKSLSKQIKIKKGENIQYSFDLELDQIVKNKLKEFNISGKIFSEESGFFNLGANNYRVIYDPFCNSSLATKTFQEAAIGISIFDYDYNFITSAILDFQTGIIGIVENNKTAFYQLQSKNRLFFKPSSNNTVEESWVVLTLENKTEREKFSKVSRIFNNSKRILISSGHIYWLKLATGQIDAYLDPIGGEKLYEMFACTIAQKSGCVVTNTDGELFNPSEFLKIFEKNQDYLFYPVAASNKDLHNDLIKKLVS